MATYVELNGQSIEDFAQKSAPLLIRHLLQASPLVALAELVRLQNRFNKTKTNLDSDNLPKVDNLVRPNEVVIRSHEEAVEFYQERIIFPKEKNRQPYLTMYISTVRGASNATFLSAVSSGQYDELYYQPFKYFARGQNLPGEQIKLPAQAIGQEKKVFFKVTIGPTKAELFDPVRILIDLGYDHNKIKVIQGVRNPQDTYLSIKRIGVDEELSIEEFNNMYLYMITLFTLYIIGRDHGIAAPTTMIFELLDETTEMSAIMEKMFGVAFEPIFPSLEQLLAMRNVHWLEANPNRFPDYFEKFILPVLEHGFYARVSHTNVGEMFRQKPHLEEETTEVYMANSGLYNAIGGYIHK